MAFRAILHEAACLLLRCQLAEGLRRWIERDELTQAQAAKKLGVSQPRISDIVRNKLENYSLDYLVGLCAKADITVTVKVKQKPAPRPKNSRRSAAKLPKRATTAATPGRTKAAASPKKTAASTKRR